MIDGTLEEISAQVLANATTEDSGRDRYQFTANGVELVSVTRSILTDITIITSDGSLFALPLSTYREYLNDGITDPDVIKADQVSQVTIVADSDEGN